MRLAFAYGSGIFQQHGSKDVSKNMMDFIFAVDNPQLWHKENLRMNRGHYSFMKYFGSHAIARVQDNYNANIYFNTLVKCEGRLIKYGVISTASLKRDLNMWDTLYVAGRLHKPVLYVKPSDDPDLSMSLEKNLEHALHAALIILPHTFTELQLYHTIAGLSYAGDIRMKGAENPNKVENIVGPRIEEFHKLYLDFLIQENQHVVFNESKSIFEQDKSIETVVHYLMLLPKTVKMRLVEFFNKDGRNRDTEEVLLCCAKEFDCEEIVLSAVKSIVAVSSKSQTSRGLLMAGMIKSIRYGGQKVFKGMKRSKEITLPIEK